MGTKLHFKPGSFYRVCDRTGFAVRAENTQKQWNNIIVRNRSFEERQPQDFVRGRRDDQTVPEPRPRQQNVFLGVQTTVVYSILFFPAPGWTVVPQTGAFSSGFSSGFDIGTPGILVENATGFNAGDSISIQLDNGTMYFTTVYSVDYSANKIFLPRALPSPASGGNVVTDMTSFNNV